MEKAPKDVGKITVNIGGSPDGDIDVENEGGGIKDMNNEITSTQTEAASSSDDSGNTPCSDTGFATDSLEAMRKRLLDLTGRNRLLNFHHGRGGHIRVIDELPDQMHELLLDEKPMHFKSVPEPKRDELIRHGYIAIDEVGDIEELKPNPNAAEWAKVLGFETGYELPKNATTGFSVDVANASRNIWKDVDPATKSRARSSVTKHLDDAIQTLLFPYELETRLRGIHNKARIAIEESGANILYLGFGFLEWYESADSDKANIAPLYLVPVQLERGKIDAKTSTYVYTLNYTGEDILPNLSLREKLRLDFGFPLPDLDNETKPEDYFEEIRSKILQHKPRWKVRRYCTLSLFHFGKLLMYLDLDPSRWPGRSITKHKLIRQFFGTGSEAEDDSASMGGGDNEIFGEERDVDRTPDIHTKYPLIDDADSSQHTALMEVMDGRNLVIEGPPGTGKSQTITNMIAAAIADGKKVLFVAEKLAALEVVKSRLDKAGLGEFCLELHSHKTQKRRVLDDLSLRVKKQGTYRHPKEIDADISQYEELKDKLRLHAELINSNWKNTGKTFHEILMKAARFRPDIDVTASKLHPAGITGISFTPEQQRSLLGHIRIYKDMCEAIGGQLSEGGDLLTHPWFGINNSDLQTFDTSEVLEPLNQWQDSLREVQRVNEDVANFLEVPADEFSSFGIIEKLYLNVSQLPPLRGDEDCGALPRIQGDVIQQLKNALLLYRRVQMQYFSLAVHVDEELLSDLTQLDLLLAARDEFLKIGVSVKMDFVGLDELAREIDQLQHRVSELHTLVTEMHKHFPDGVCQHIKLSQKGLRELSIFVELITSLPQPLWKMRNALFDNDEIDVALKNLIAEIEKLREQRIAMAAIYDLGNLPDLTKLKRINKELKNSRPWSWMKSDWRKCRKALLDTAAHEGVNRRWIRDNVDSLITYAEELEKFNDHKQYAQLFGEYFGGLDTNEVDLKTVRAWYASIRKEYGFSFGPRVAIGDAILTMDSNVALGVCSLSDKGIVEQIAFISSGLLELRDSFSGVTELSMETWPIYGDEGPLEMLLTAFRECLAPCQHFFKKNDLSFGRMVELISDLQDLRANVQKWGKEGVIDEVFLGTRVLKAGLHVDDNGTLDSVEHTLSLAEHLDEHVEVSFLKKAIYAKPSSELFAGLKRLNVEIKKALDQSLNRFELFQAATLLDKEAWQFQSGDNLDGLINRNCFALSRPDWLSSWLDYIRVRHVVELDGFKVLVSFIESGELAPSKLESAFYLGIYDSLARELFAENNALEIFSGLTQNSIREQFCTIDHKLKKLQQEKIAWRVSRNKVPQGVSAGKVSQFSELSLIKRECEKKRMHRPVRELVKRASNALVALKPCFMMGPMSVAQYLAPGMLEFDLVIMDEASQVKPQDALGAIARGRQLVVVGDPKQLPPTSFFDRVVEEDGNDHVAIEESESILDTALPMFNARRLRWHYRSQHESLIAFSNHNFYDGDLVVFPSPNSASDEYGVKLTRIKKGCFINRRNIEEAKVIAQTVASHLVKRPNESIGVVAMNSEQREQIDRAIEEACKDDPFVQAAYEKNRNQGEPLFIKNLENVQGDERDVILISITYGPPDVGGKVPQRFGPINSGIGWRRLNVLFTRSKKRMHIFTSMGAEDVLASGTSSRGVRALKDFLAFAQTGNLYQAQHTGRSADSDFEIAVLERLSREGFECEPQVGVAGFFIDLAVKDPGKPGRFLMGIECDGATYHSAKSVRDRDRLRQAVLERLGWRIRRIWSTDWFRNPEVALEAIVRELHKLKTEIVEDDDILIEDFSQYEMSDEIAQSPVDLKEKLMDFDANVIREKYPNTEERKRLLSPAMLNAFLHHQPTSMLEFRECIPSYLRHGMDLDEAEFLNQVLNIIVGSEVEETPPESEEEKT